MELKSARTRTPVTLTSVQDEHTVDCASLTEAASYLGCSHAAVRKALDNPNRKCKNFRVASLNVHRTFSEGSENVQGTFMEANGSYTLTPSETHVWRSLLNKAADCNMTPSMWLALCDPPLAADE